MRSTFVTPGLSGRATRLGGVAGVLASSTVLAQSGPSNAILGAQLNSAGGLSVSANNVVTACIGEDIAGFASSASFQAEIGCGPYSIGLAFEPADAGASISDIPGLAAPALALLAALMVAFVARRFAQNQERVCGGRRGPRL